MIAVQMYFAIAMVALLMAGTLVFCYWLVVDHVVNQTHQPPADLVDIETRNRALTRLNGAR